MEKKSNWCHTCSSLFARTLDNCHLETDCLTLLRNILLVHKACDTIRIGSLYIARLRPGLFYLLDESTVFHLVRIYNAESSNDFSFKDTRQQLLLQNNSYNNTCPSS